MKIGKSLYNTNFCELDLFLKPYRRRQVEFSLINKIDAYENILSFSLYRIYSKLMWQLKTRQYLNENRT